MHWSVQFIISSFKCLGVQFPGFDKYIHTLYFRSALLWLCLLILLRALVHLL